MRFNKAESEDSYSHKLSWLKQIIIFGQKNIYETFLRFNKNLLWFCGPYLKCMKVGFMVVQAAIFRSSAWITQAAVQSSNYWMSRILLGFLEACRTKLQFYSISPDEVLHPFSVPQTTAQKIKKILLLQWQNTWGYRRTFSKRITCFQWLKVLPWSKTSIPSYSFWKTSEEILSLHVYWKNSILRRCYLNIINFFNFWH